MARRFEFSVRPVAKKSAANLVTLSFFGLSLLTSLLNVRGGSTTFWCRGINSFQCRVCGTLARALVAKSLDGMFRNYVLAPHRVSELVPHTATN
jgi:hypothetical protein